MEHTLNKSTWLYKKIAVFTGAGTGDHCSFDAEMFKLLPSTFLYALSTYTYNVVTLYGYNVPVVLVHWSEYVFTL